MEGEEYVEEEYDSEGEEFEELADDADVLAAQEEGVEDYISDDEEGEIDADEGRRTQRAMRRWKSLLGCMLVCVLGPAPCLPAGLHLCWRA